MFLIIGLGNPGPKYNNTRHNIGFKAVEIIADRFGLSWENKPKFKADIAYGQIAVNKAVNKAVLCKPDTYMNLSGEAAVLVALYYKIPPEKIIVIHDDIDLELAAIKYKQGGGTAGHNGLKSLDFSLRTKDYYRIRVGVGRPENKNIDIADYVLGNFLPQEYELLLSKLESQLENILSLLVNPPKIHESQTSIGLHGKKPS